MAKPELVAGALAPEVILAAAERGPEDKQAKAGRAVMFAVLMRRAHAARPGSAVAPVVATQVSGAT
jgi:hypothetical protein